MNQPSKEPRSGDRLSEFNSDGNYKSHVELLPVALEVSMKLTPEEIEAMLLMPDAVPSKTNWRIKISLVNWGLISPYCRSGDGARDFTNLGKLVVSMIKP